MCTQVSSYGLPLLRSDYDVKVYIKAAYLPLKTPAQYLNIRESAWQNFPELLDMMSLRGLGKTATWAAIVLDKVVAKQHQERGDGGPQGVP